MKEQIDKIFKASKDIRYVAIYRDGELFFKVKSGLDKASGSDSDRYEELLVNPAILTLVGQRGDLDCGGSRFVVVRYGNFYQFVMPVKGGHVSVCIEPSADVFSLSQRLHDEITVVSTTWQSRKALTVASKWFN